MHAGQVLKLVAFRCYTVIIESKESMNKYLINFSMYTYKGLKYWGGGYAQFLKGYIEIRYEDSGSHLQSYTE